MDNTKNIAKNIFFKTGSSLLTTGESRFNTTTLPAILPAVFVGAFCFQAIQHLWQIRQSGKKLEIAQLAAETDALKEALTELGITEQKHYDQIEECLRWICIALHNLGDRIQSLEISDLRQEQVIQNIIEELNIQKVTSTIKIAVSTFLSSQGVHNLPYPSLGNLFKGRDQILTELDKQLISQKATAITHALVINGLGGIGKTRLAVEYAWHYQYQYSNIFFIKAESPELFRANLAGLIKLDLLNWPEQNISEEEKQMIAVLHWLQANTGWLMIIDNVDCQCAAKEVEDKLPKLAKGQVIITSRLSNWSGAICQIPLAVIAPDPARDFLLARTDTSRQKQADDPKQAELLADRLGYLPLALEQAAAYISRKRYSFARYLQGWDTEKATKLKWSDSQLMNYPVSIAVTWHRTFTQLSLPARTLLRLSSFLASEPIPIRMFKEQHELVKESIELLAQETGEKQTTAQEQNIEDILGELTGFSMATIQGETFSIHRMVQEVLRTQIPQKEINYWIEKSLNILDAFRPSPPDDVRTWETWNLLRPHVTLLIQIADKAKAGIPEPTSSLMNALGLFLKSRIIFNEAESLYRRALEIDEAAYGSTRPDVARDLNNLAQLLQDTNRLKEAEPLMRRALEIDEKAHGATHPKVAIRLNNLAQLLQDTNRFKEAEPLMRRALEIDEKAYGSTHPDVAIDLNNLAQLLQATNRLKEAEPLMQRVIDIFERAYGTSHPNVATALNNLAQLLQDTNRLKEAEPLMRRALEIDKAAYGATHPKVATDLNNLAQLLQDTNRLKEAEPLIQRTLEIDEQAYGLTHPKVARDLNNLAQLLQATNRLKEAEPLMQRVIDIFERAYGTSHPNVATALNNLAQLLQDMNQLKEAEPLMQRALEIDKAAYGTTHPKVARDLNNLAQLLQDTNRLKEAEPLMQRTLEIDEAAYGSTHPKVAIRLNNLAQLLQDTNRLKEAEPLMRRALEIDEKAYGAMHPNVARDLNNLAQLLQATNRLKEAEPLMRQALEIFENSLGSDHPSAQTVHKNLAILLDNK